MRAGEVTFPVELTVVATNAVDGEPIFTAYVRDITDRLRQEEELRRHADDLELQHRQKDAFVATLAHELRNPLAPIHGAVHVLKATVDSNPALQKMVAIIERQSQTLARLVDDLLDMSRISRGSIELQLEEVSIGEIAAEAMEVSAPTILAAGHELRTSIADSGQTFLADRVRVVQILGNLLNNAAKYTPSGGRIEFSSGAMEREVEFRVVDTGIGISADEIPKLFEMFVQGDSVDGRVPAGLGIGLTLAAALARLHGGTVSATSAGKGKGAEFIVRLPVQAANV
jgi:signal transduction histidine kinase